MLPLPDAPEAQFRFERRAFGEGPLRKPLMFGFANSVGEFVADILGVAIPLVILILISNTLAKLVRQLRT
jgi:hypothetical protein